MSKIIIKTHSKMIIGTEVRRPKKMKFFLNRMVKVVGGAVTG